MKKLFGVTLLALTSAFLGYFVGYSAKFDEIEAKMDAEVDEIRQFYREKAQKDDKKEIKKDEKSFKCDKKVSQKDKTFIKKEDNKVHYNLMSKPDIDSLAKKYDGELMYNGDEIEGMIAGKVIINGEEMDPEEAENYISGERMNKQQKQDEEENPYPILIDEDSFNNEYEHYDKIEIDYWSHDENFSDDRDELIHNPESIFGKDIVEKCKRSKTGDEFYVRNHKQGADYYIMNVPKSYTGAILGITGEEFKGNIGSDGDVLDEDGYEEYDVYEDEKPIRESIKRRKDKVE